MQLEQQLCNLDQAIRLKELGVQQGVSLFFLKSRTLSTIIDIMCRGEMAGYTIGWIDKHNDWAGKVDAWTVAELGIALPAVVDKCSLDFWKTSNSGFRIAYRDEQIGGYVARYIPNAVLLCSSIFSKPILSPPQM